MLEYIFGNRTAALVLLQLEKQGEVHATGIARDLGIALNMVQKQLARWERGGILQSKRKGRRRVYFWDSSCPLLNNVHQLLVQGERFLSQDSADVRHLSYDNRLRAAGRLIHEGIQLMPDED